MSDDTIIRDDEVRFELEHPFKYATKGGDQETAQFILLNPPTTRNSKECAALKQAFYRASNSIAEETGESAQVEGDAAGPNPIGIITVMAMSTAVDLADTLEVARRLFSSGLAQVDGEVKLTNKLIESMSQDDFEKMLGVYLVNFTLASGMAQAKKMST